MVGRNIIEHRLAESWHVLAPTSQELDLTDAKSVGAYVAASQPDIVVHAAGLVGGIQANLDNPIGFLEKNVMMGRNIIMASFESGVQRFLNLASTCMYPRLSPNPLNENMILAGGLEPTNEGYALAKIVATRLCQYIDQRSPLVQYKTIIPCNLFGRYDKFHPKHSHLLPAIIHKVHCAKIEGATSVEIWGDGSARREFMYAGDLADAVMRAATHMEALPDLMNCGLGHDKTINEYYEIVADVIGWKGTFTHDLSKPVGMMQKLCCIRRQEDWGWSAPTPLREGIKATYDFYLSEASI